MSFHAPPHAWWLLTFGLCWLSVMYGRKEGYSEACRLNRVDPLVWEPPPIIEPDWSKPAGVRLLSAEEMAQLFPRPPSVLRRAADAVARWWRQSP